MRRRSRGREYALQLLYQLDICRGDPANTLQEFWTHHLVPPDVRHFADKIVRGTMQHLAPIDALIAGCANNWDINRMAVVDRNILRMGVYELLHAEDVPPKVCLNEAVELAKRYGDEESSRFVNGILDTIHKRHNPRAAESSESAHSADPADPAAPPVNP
jgi:N utilization substance protein B